MTTPRQHAVAAGDKWYVPTKPCGHCGQRAPRYVANGRCQGCSLPANTKALMEAAPRAVITRQEAVAMGMIIYRTGAPCKYGHSGYRYVSTCHCVECLR